VVLDDRLYEEGGAGQVVEIGHDPHALGVEALELGARLGDARPGPVGRVIRTRPQQHLFPLRSSDRQATGDHARAGDTESFPQSLSSSASFSTTVRWTADASVQYGTTDWKAPLRFRGI
jgi:hypothetical protein